MLFAWEWKVRMKSHFHITGFTASLALKQKFGATRKFSEMVYFSKLFWGSNRPEPPKPRPPPRQRGWLLPRHKRQLCSRKTPPLASKSPWKLCNNDKGLWGLSFEHFLMIRKFEVTFVGWTNCYAEKKRIYFGLPLALLKTFLVFVSA